MRTRAPANWLISEIDFSSSSERLRSESDGVHVLPRVGPRLSLRNTGGRLREVYPLRWKTNRRRRKRTLLGTSVADKLTKAILPRPSRSPHYRKPVDSGTIYTVKSPTTSPEGGRAGGGENDRETKSGRSGMKSFSIWESGRTASVCAVRFNARWPASKSPVAILCIALAAFVLISPASLAVLSAFTASSSATSS